MKNLDNTIRKALVLLTVLSVSFCAFSQEQTGAVLSFKQDLLDFGLLYTDSLPDGKVDIEFVNTGSEPLILSNVTACCGTRVHDWPRTPILPDESGIIKIEFRLAARAHRLSRVVTVTSNSTDNPTARFRIIGQIEEKQ